MSKVIYVEKRGNGMAVAAMVIGLIGVLFGLIPLFFFIAWICGAIAIVLGSTARGAAIRRPEIGRKNLATWGIVLGIAALAFGTFGMNQMGGVLDDFEDDMEQIEKEWDEDLEGLE